MSYRIETVKDEKGLADVYKLFKEGLVDIGDISPDVNVLAVSNPGLDYHQSTTVLAVWDVREIIGTISLTIDSEKGLNTDHSFKNETDRVRAGGSRVASVWRMATKTAHKYGSRLVVDMIRKVCQIAVEKGVKVSLFTIATRYEKIYASLIRSTVIARGEVNFDDTSLPASLIYTNNSKLRRTRLLGDIILNYEKADILNYDEPEHTISPLDRHFDIRYPEAFSIENNHKVPVAAD